MNWIKESWFKIIVVICLIYVSISFVGLVNRADSYLKVLENQALGIWPKP